MAQIRPKILLRYGRINEPVRVPSFDLLVDSGQTFLTSDSASGSSTLTVKNITGFAVNQILLVGDAGNEGSEIIKTHASTAPSGSTITLASNTVFPHSANTKVSVLTYDQIEISNAATVTGAKTVLAGQPITIVADDIETKFNDNTSSGGYYFARFKNSITALYSPYSPAAPYAGYTPSSARSVIDKALGMINKKTSEVLSDEYAFSEIDNCQEEVKSELKRWSWMQSFNTSLGETSTAQWRVAVPTDLDDQNTNKSVYNFRIGKEANMTWVDKEKFDELTQDVAHTTLNTSIIVGATSIVLTDSSDFDDSGVIVIGANSYTYTANDRSTNTLTITASTTTNTAGQDVFQGATQGTPRYWTTFGGYIYHYPITDSTLNARNYYLDYYKALTSIQNDSDTIVIPDPNVVIYYLAWKFLLKQSNGSATPDTEAMYGKYLLRLNTLKKKEVIGRTFKLRPRFNHWDLQTFSDDDKRIRLGNFPDA